MESENNCNDLRSASFAVYLTPLADESFVKKLGDSSRYPACSREDKHLSLGSMKITEKSFNEKVEDSSSLRLIDDYLRKGVPKKEARLDHCASVSKSRSSVTPSMSTKSGWNIRDALLRGFKKNPVQGRQGSFGFVGRGFFRRLGCNKSCSDEKSVHVREEYGQEHPPQLPVLSGSRVQTKDGFPCLRFNGASSTVTRREDLFAFPILGNVLHKEFEERRSQGDVGVKEDYEDPRHSIEVFGSGHKDKKKGDVVALNLERKLSILTWDAIPKPYCPKASPRSCILNDDQESEASSDLFEIENISGTAGMVPLFAPRPSDGFSGYEPSEASIEWSVVTGSGADFSEYDEKEVQEINSVTTTCTPSMRALGEKDGARNRPTGGFLRCKSLKMVRVAETAMKTNERPRSPPLDSTIHSGKSLGDDNKVQK